MEERKDIAGKLYNRKKAEKTCWCAAAARFLTGLWAFLMLTVFPLYMRNRYSQMGLHKFRFFLAASCICLIPAGICRVFCARRKCAEWGRSGLHGKMSVLDWAVLFYLAAAVVSWCLSVDRQEAWIGANGWFAGLRMQLLLGLIYFLVSRQFPWRRVILFGHFLSSGLVFLLGIGHRFQVDPLGLYEGVQENYQLLFLSTIGQASWYSSYVCIVLVIGVTGFFLAERAAAKWALGFYCMLGFATVVTQNSDSAFAAVALLVFGLFLAACDSRERMERFLEILLLMFGSFKIVGILQQLFPDRAMRLGGFSEFMSQSTVTWLAFLAVCVLYVLLLFAEQKAPDRHTFVHTKMFQRMAVILAVAAVALYVLAVWLNTTGRLQSGFGIQSRNQYLLFDQDWGNSRGFIWSFTWECFGELSMLRKWFGVGPDCFSAYCYSFPELSARLDHIFGWEQTLTNAHNEFLNTMFCLGILGLIAYLSVFVSAVGRFWHRRKETPAALAGMLAALVYAAHNFFCYQQVCCAPFLFLILGMAENQVRNSDFSSCDRQ